MHALYALRDGYWSPSRRLSSLSPCSSLRDVSSTMLPSRPALPNRPRMSGVEVGEVIVQPRIEVSKIFSQPKLAKYRVRAGGGEGRVAGLVRRRRLASCRAWAAGHPAGHASSTAHLHARCTSQPLAHSAFPRSLQDLYIQAMTAIKALPPHDPESFFQQASIHGGRAVRLGARCMHGMAWHGVAGHGVAWLAAAMGRQAQCKALTSVVQLAPLHPC